MGAAVERATRPVAELCTILLVEILLKPFFLAYLMPRGVAARWIRQAGCAWPNGTMKRQITASMGF